MQRPLFKIFGLPAVVLLGVSGLNADSLTVGDVYQWNVGSGQSNGAFQVLTIDNFAGGGALELGLRAQQRRIGPVTPVGSTYYVQAGPDTNLPAQTNRAWWNFDYSAHWAGTSNLDHLYLSISTLDGSPVTAPGTFDLLTIPGLGLQDSQNPTFGWFAPFDMNLAATYHFELTAVEGDYRATNRMDVVVTPEPSQLAAAMVLFGAVMVIVRRKKLAA